jgi:DNA-binding response OmpR family regulator
VSDPNTPGGDFAPTLVIDANGAAGEQLAEQLKHAGFAADTVDSCGAALSAARSKHYGSMIFVGDLSQPNDLQCIAGLRWQAPRTWIIMVSSTELQDTRELFQRYGVDALLGTPFSMKDLVSRLMAFSRRSRPV